MAEELFQGPNPPHGLQANVNPLEDAERELQEAEDPGIFGGPGTAAALEPEPAD